jgi:transcriptional regulator with XRE-family HTH domain
MTTAEFGHRIRKIRLVAGYETQAEFARALGVTRGLVASWESHRKKPGWGVRERIVRLTGVSVDYLSGISADPKASMSTSDPDEIMVLQAMRRTTPEMRRATARWLEVFL